ncbi:HAD family hydrolase [Patescibacteria group bacterium]|nr:HAD family hydrolase [Patescibacteria group bacterium]
MENIEQEAGPNSTESPIKCVCWDGDNTLFGWLEYAVFAYEAMCESIAEISGKSPEIVAAGMKEFYTSAGTLEHEGLIQGLQTQGFFQDIPNFNQEEAIRKAQSVFSEERRERLKTYPGIVDVMKEINNRKIRQVLLTDAPARQAQARLKHTRLDEFISEIYAMPSPTVPQVPDSFKRSPNNKNPKLHILSNEKPHIDLESILQMTRKEISETVAIIGDNQSKDMALAVLYDCLGIHAKYGVISDKDLLNRILRFSPINVASRNTQTSSIDFTQNNKIKTASTPSDILNFLFSITNHKDL